MDTPTPSPHGHHRSSDLKPERVNKPTCLSVKRPYVREWRNIKNMSLIAPTSNENKSTIPYLSCIFFNFAGNSLHWWLESCISTIAWWWCRQTFKRHETRRAYAVIGCHLGCTEINLCLLYRIRVKPHRRFNVHWKIYTSNIYSKLNILNVIDKNIIVHDFIIGQVKS